MPSQPRRHQHATRLTPIDIHKTPQLAPALSSSPKTTILFCIACIQPALRRDTRGLLASRPKDLFAMKRGGILNPSICSLLAELGHGDELLIVDAGYPIPTDSHVIDLTLTPGIPRLLDVLRAVTDELVIEGITVAQEASEESPKMYQEILKTVGDVDIDEVPFHEFKEQSEGVKGIIRTAEFTPFASVRITCGSAF